ncbi:MAG: beta strand repeat-containing protein, partial [Holosporales bacterium]
MTTVLINKPSADTTVSYDIASGDKIVFKTPLKNVKMNLVGSDVVVYWPDGGKVVLVGAGLSMFNAEDTTLFETVDGKIMTGNELLAQMGKLETVLASEIDKISAVFEEKKQDTTADSKEIQQLKSLLNEKSATPSFKAIDEVLSPTDALNPEVNQSKLQEVMRKADETFRRVQDEDGFHGRYNMIPAPPVTPIEPGLPPPEPAKPEYFSLFVQHTLFSGDNGGSGNLGTKASARFGAESFAAIGGGIIYGDDPSKFNATNMQQVLNFRVNDLTDFEAGLKQSGLLKGNLDTYKFTIEVPGGLPDGIQFTYNNTVLSPTSVAGNQVYTILTGGSTSLNIGVTYLKSAFTEGATIKTVMKGYFVDSAVTLPETGEPEYAFVYNDTGEGSTFKFVDPTTLDATQSLFNSSFALPLSPVGTNITGSSADDVIVPGIGRSGAAANTIDGGGNSTTAGDNVNYASMFSQAGLSADTKVIINNGLKAVTVGSETLAPGGTVFLDSANPSFANRKDLIKNVESVTTGAGDDVFYGNIPTTNLLTGTFIPLSNLNGFNAGAGNDTLNFSLSGSDYSVWGVTAQWRQTGTLTGGATGRALGTFSDVENFVGSPFYDQLYLYSDAPKSGANIPLYDGGVGWNGNDNFISFRNVPSGPTAGNVLYFDADAPADSAGYRTAWIGNGTPGNGTGYQIKNFRRIQGTVNDDAVDLRGSNYFIYYTGGGKDTVAGTGSSELDIGGSVTGTTTFTFDGTVTSTPVNLGSFGTITEDRAYRFIDDLSTPLVNESTSGLPGSGVNYAGMNSMSGFQGAVFNYSGNNPTAGYGAWTVANPFLQNQYGYTTVDLSGYTGGAGVVFLAGGNYWEMGDASWTMYAPTLNAVTTINIDMFGGTTDNNPGLLFTISSVESLIGTQYDDTLASSTAGTVTINAGDGNDSLYSVDAYRSSVKTVTFDNFAGDVVNGEDDNDIFYRIVDDVQKSVVSTSYRDTLNGGAGTDTLVLSAVKVTKGAAINQSAVLGAAAPVRAFFESTQFTGNLASVASKSKNTAGATLSNIENVVIGGAGFAGDDAAATANQYWFTADQTATARTPAAMLFNDNDAVGTDTVTTYTGNVLVYFDGLGTANINQPGGTYSIGSITNQSININPATGATETLGSGQISLFALGDVGNANGRSVAVDLTNAVVAGGGTLQYSGGGGVNKIWRPSLAQGGADDDIYAVYTTAQADTITGDAFGNIIFTGGGKDTVSVGAGKDTVYAAGGEATSLNLGNDNDVLEAAFYKTSVTANTSTVDGGAGTDSLQFGLTNTGWSQPGGGRQILGVDWNAVGVDLDLTTGKATGTSLLGTGNTIDFSNFEQFHLTNGADTVTVNDTVMGALTSSNLIDASPLRVGGIYESATTTGYSPAGYNGANSNEKFFASNNT